MNNLKLSELFKKCLNADYKHTLNSGDYSIEIEDNILYLLFQWSQGDEDWKNNFNFIARAYKKGINKWYCHAGFHKVWKSIREELEPEVLNILEGNLNIDTIKCIGYSHGGPLAGFATEDMEFIYGSCYKVSGYGFGCPRFIWGFLPKDVKERFKNFIPIRNIPDLVTHVPPVIFGYGHGGKLLKIGKMFDIIKIWKTYLIKPRGPIKAHYDSEYIKSLKELEK